MPTIQISASDKPGSLRNTVAEGSSNEGSSDNLFFVFIPPIRLHAC